jgi:lysozyme
MNEDLSLSRAGANLVKHFESCLHPCGPDRFKAYLCPAGVWTIGWGTTSENGHKIKSGMVWTQRQCDAAFMVDMKHFENDVRRLVTCILMQWQFDALTSLVYNIGASAFAGSTLLKRTNAMDFEAAALEFHRWNKGGGKVLAGLVRRRASESLLFQNIADNNYDGKPDKVIVPLSDAMPQAVDAPK